MTHGGVEKIISKTEKLGFIEPTLISSKKIYRPTADEIATLSFYKNNISHLFMLYSLICEAVKFVKKVPKAEITRAIEIIYPIFAKDFHLKKAVIDQKDIEQAIDLLISKKLIEEDECECIFAPNETSLQRQNYISLSNLCEPSLKRFYIVMNYMWQNEVISKDDLKEKCGKLAKELEKIEGWPYPEFSDKAKFDNFVYMMKEAKFFREDKNGNLEVSKITQRVKKLYEQFFDKDFIEFIDKQAS